MLKTDKELTIEVVNAYLQSYRQIGHGMSIDNLNELITSVHKKLCELPDTRHEYLTLLAEKAAK